MQTRRTNRRVVVKSESKSSRPKAEPSRIAEDEIRERAGEIYLARMAAGRHGDAMSDWLQAERELKQRGE